MIDALKRFEGEEKKIVSFIKVNKVVEVPNGKEKASILIYFSYLIKLIV